MTNETTQHKFKRLYPPVHQSLQHFCRALSGNVPDAEDLMHDTILQAIQSINRLKNEQAFKTYIFGIASNFNKMRFRRKKFHAEFNNEEVLALTDYGTSPEYMVEFRMVYDRIMQLPAKQSEALILFHISDMSLEDIQKIQGGSLSAVKQRLKRGREKLLEQCKSPGEKVVTMLFLSF